MPGQLLLGPTLREPKLEDGKTAFLKLASDKGIVVDTTEDASAFNEENLKKYRAVVFLSTTGDVLDQYQQAFALEVSRTSRGGHSARNTFCPLHSRSP